MLRIAWKGETSTKSPPDGGENLNDTDFFELLLLCPSRLLLLRLVGVLGPEFVRQILASFCRATTSRCDAKSSASTSTTRADLL